VKIVQRLPVRIAIDPASNADHSLRLGLSAKVEVNTLAEPRQGPAPAKASGAARPSRLAAATPVTDIARVGAMTPTETDAVPMKPSSRRNPGRDSGVAECGWAVLS